MDRLVVDSGKFGLVTKRNVDSQRQRATVLPPETQSLLGVVESKLPLAVEIEPDTANKLWTRILWAGDLFLSKNHALTVNSHKKSQNFTKALRLD